MLSKYKIMQPIEKIIFVVLTIIILFGKTRLTKVSQIDYATLT